MTSENQSAGKLITWGFFLLMFGVVVAAGTCQGGCDYGLDVTVGVKLDKCSTMLPDCAGSNFSCGFEEPDGRWVVDPDCRVGCALGRTLTCEPDGPSCDQRVGEGEQWVPTICVSRDGGT